MTKLRCEESLKIKVYRILDILIFNDSLQINRFEYSLQIKNRQLENSLRFVNYANYSNAAVNLYAKRINSIREISFTFCKQKKHLNKLFTLLSKFKNLSLPFYFGIEFRFDRIIFLKFYLNFFTLSHRKKDLVYAIIKNIFSDFGFKTKIKEKIIPLIGFTLDTFGNIIYHKIYYIYRNDYKFKDFYFRQQELSIFNWLNQYNRLKYFDIMERYDNNSLISKKIEVHPKNYKNILKQFCLVSNNQNIYARVKEMIKETNGKLETIGIEDDKFTIYVTMANYGQNQVLI